MYALPSGLTFSGTYAAALAGATVAGSAISGDGARWITPGGGVESGWHHHGQALGYEPNDGITVSVFPELHPWSPLDAVVAVGAFGAVGIWYRTKARPLFRFIRDA